MNLIKLMEGKDQHSMNLRQSLRQTFKLKEEIKRK